MYDTVKLKCRYLRLPRNLVVTSLSWGSASCFFVASFAASQDDSSRSLRSGVLIYRFNHWHSAWHFDQIQPPHYLLHTGLYLPNHAAALARARDSIPLQCTDPEWNRFLLCPDNYPLTQGLLCPPASASHLVVVQVELDPSSCRLFVAFVAEPPNDGTTHIAAYE
jgi:hypothetical protein